MSFTGFERFKPMESAAGAWRFTNVQAALQEITNISRKMQHPVVSPQSGTIDFAFGFDEASSGISVLTAAILHTRDKHGSRDVRNCHVLGVGEVPDSYHGLRNNFKEIVSYLDQGTAFWLFSRHAFIHIRDLEQKQLVIGDKFVSVRRMFCADYAALRSILRLQPRQFIYVNSELRTIEFNPVGSTYNVLSDAQKSRPIAKGCFRFATPTPRSQEEFQRPTDSIFPAAPLGIPLCHVFVDYDVHLQKALGGNITLAIGEVALALLENKSIPEAKKTQLRRAFAHFDNEYFLI
jgi:hypothetical protein